MQNRREHRDQVRTRRAGLGGGLGADLSCEDVCSQAPLRQLNQEQGRGTLSWSEPAPTSACEGAAGHPGVWGCDGRWETMMTSGSGHRMGAERAGAWAGGVGVQVGHARHIVSSLPFLRGQPHPTTQVIRRLEGSCYSRSRSPEPSSALKPPVVSHSGSPASRSPER